MKSIFISFYKNELKRETHFLSKYKNNNNDADKNDGFSNVFQFNV